MFPLIPLQQQVDYLPPERFEMTWSCRTPVVDGEEFSSCNECGACARRAKVSAKQNSDVGAIDMSGEPQIWSQVVKIAGPPTRD